MFNGVLYDTKEEVESVVDDYARDHFDEYLDYTFGDISVAGYTYPCSQVFKSVDPVAYRVSVSDFSNMLLNDIEEIE